MVAYTKVIPSGVPGDITRPDSAKVEPIMLASAVTAYGIPLKINGAGKAVPFSGGETAADFIGTLARGVPAMGGNANSGLLDAIPDIKKPQNLLKRGFQSVICTVGTPVREGTVYVRTVAASGKLVGDFEATADGSNSVALTNVRWATNGKDASNNAEIRIGL